ncbi:hypothetical protein WP3W18E02_P12650 (plasmid) [Klebsiella sp. WP3-W18-ESBL-02]|nr:hypothetical protein WP3W18E02_P12650 [Klebsiella sp. WP3-W18-ESBL-02]BBR23605.1 hypothetical protein WP3S18E05_P13220 [Klebsiella sp. WP3-S18-ESBL-05]
MKSFLIKMSNAHNEHIREVASVDEAIRIASERANEGFWLPPSRVCEMSKEHEGRYTVGDDGWFRPIELAVPVEIEEVKSSYGNGGYDMISVGAKFAQRAKNVKLAIFLYRANIIGCLDPCQCIDQRCAFYTKVTTYSGFGHASFQRF